MSELKDAVIRLLENTDPQSTAQFQRGDSAIYLNELWHELARLVGFQRNAEGGEWRH